MATFEVLPPEDQRETNTYRIVVGSDDHEFLEGIIYIEPPIQIGECLIDMMTDDSDLIIQHRLTTPSATTLDFWPNTKGNTRIIGKERILHSIHSLYRELGFTASAEAFTDYWNQYGGTTDESAGE